MAPKWAQVLAVVLLAASACAYAGGEPPGLTSHAVELLQQGKAREAIPELQRVIRERPAYFPAYSLIGVCYSQLGRPEQAQPYLRKAVELAPQSLEARGNLGANYLALKKPAEAAAEFERILAADSARVNAWVNLANSRLRMGHTQQALAALERARALAPDDVEVQLATAETKFQMGRRAEALEQLEEIGKSPDLNLQLAVGLVLERNGQSQEAAAHFARCGESDSGALLGLAEKSINEGDYTLGLALLNAVASPLRGSAAWHALTGYAHFKLEHPKPALEHLQQAVRLDPTNEDHYLELAEYLGANNAVTAVMAVLETAGKALPRSAKIPTALAVGYLMQADFAKAEPLLQSLIKANPGDEIPHQLLADCYQRMQRWEKLRQAAAALRRSAPDNSLGWYYGALAEYQMLEAGAAGGSIEAIRQYTRKAAELNPGDWRTYVLGGKLLLRDGRTEAALLSFRKAVAANPQEPTPHYLLASTLRQTGASEQSKVEFEAFRAAQANEKSRRFRSLVVEIARREPATK